MSTLGERLRGERERLGLSQTDFAALGGAKKHSQINYEADRTAPDTDYLSALGRHGVDMLYVLTGTRTPPPIQQAQAFIRQNSQIFEAAERAAALQRLAARFEGTDEDFVAVPVHDAMLAAGDGVDNATEDQIGHLAFRSDWLKRINLKPENAVIARARGDSMQPCIWDSDVLLIDRSRTEPPGAPKKGTPSRRPPIFALLDDGEAKVKRIQLQEGGMAALISDNPDYPPQFIRVETLKIIGKVVWWGHTSKD